MKTQTRNPAIDLIKSIAIVAIVLFHYADHGAINLSEESISGSWVLLSIFKMGGVQAMLCSSYALDI